MALSDAMGSGLNGSEPWAPLIQNLLQLAMQRATESLSPRSQGSVGGITPEDTARQQQESDVTSYLSRQLQPIQGRFAPFDPAKGSYGAIPGNRRNDAMTEFVNSLDPQRVGPHFSALQRYMNEQFGGPDATNRWYGQRFVPPAGASIGNFLTLGMGGLVPQGGPWDQAVQRMNSIANQAGADVGMTRGFNSPGQFMRDAILPIGIGAASGAGLSRVPAAARWLGPRLPLVGRAFGGTPPPVLPQPGFPAALAGAIP